MSSEVETSLDVFFALDGETRSAFAQSYDGASDFAVGCPTPTQLAAQFFKATAFVFGRGQSSARRLDCTSSGAQIGLAVPCQPFVGPGLAAQGGPALPGHRPANASRTTAPVCSICSVVCAVEMKPVSNCDGAK